MSNNQQTNAKVILGIFGTMILLFAGFGIGGGNVRRTQSANLPASEVLNYLSADDVAMLLEEAGNPSLLAAMADDLEKRNEVLKQLKQLLLVASEAEAVGTGQDQDVRDNIEISEMQVLATAYEKNSRTDRNDADQSFSPLGNLNSLITEHDLLLFWQNGENESKFERLLKSAESQNLNGETVTDDQRKTFREQYAKLVIAAERARAADLNLERQTWLQIEIRKAQIFVQAYARKYPQSFEPTEDEISAYVAEHPELDSRRIRERAETVLQRARAGEDFAALANEFSADPGSNDRGGLYENVKKGQFVPEFEAAALRLEAGQISDIVASKYGFHVIQLIGKTDDSYTVRHILIDRAVGEKPSNAFNRVGFEERAKDAAQKSKTERFFAELEQRYFISLPRAEDIVIKSPLKPTPTPAESDSESCEDCGHGTGGAAAEVATEPNHKIEASNTPVPKLEISNKPINK